MLRLRRTIDKVFAVREWRKIARKINYRQTHRENNKQQNRQRQKKWKMNHPKETIEYNRKHCANHRKLGFIPLNQPFESSEGHHIDKNFVVYIPKKLHGSISHNIQTGKGMTEINDKVFEWLKLSMVKLS